MIAELESSDLAAAVEGSYRGEGTPDGKEVTDEFVTNNLGIQFLAQQLDIPHDRVGFGSRVTVQDVDTKVKETYALTLGEFVEGGEEDGQEIQVSMASPLGKALLGCKKGETVSLALPVGKRRLKVTQVLTVHDLAAGHRD